MEKMWAGRTSGAVSAVADDFNSSISFDKKMYRQDVRGSMEHALMLSARGIISEAEYISTTTFITECVFYRLAT